MKTILSLFSLSLAALPLQAFDHSELDSVLRTYVDSKGQVNYAALQKNRAELDRYLTSTGSVSESQFKSWGQSERLAFLINVYNAETLQFIIDNYPTPSIKRLGGFLSSPWDKKNVTLFGKPATLNQLEHKIIRKDFSEPRIHFALVCAAKGCPPLRNEAFTGGKLDAQLNDQTQTFLAESEKNRIEGNTLYLSPIFDWYRKDFVTGGKRLNDFVDPFMKEDASGKEVEFTEYDWSLNQQ